MIVTSWKVKGIFKADAISGNKRIFFLKFRRIYVIILVQNSGLQTS